MKNLYRILAENPNVQLLSSNSARQKKGGRRFVTTSYKAFAAKRDYLQSQNICIMGITHVGNHYGIEW